MEHKLLITFPCKVGELLDKIQSAVADELDKHEICTAGYDGDGDAIFVTQDYLPKSKQEPKDVLKCKNRIGMHCNSPTVREFGAQQILMGRSPLICPFKDGNECKDYETERGKEASKP